MACVAKENYVGKLQEILNKSNFLSPIYGNLIDNNISQIKKVSVRFQYGEKCFKADGEGMRIKDAKQEAAKYGLCQLYHHLNNDGKGLKLQPDYFILIQSDLDDFKKKSKDKSTCDYQEKIINKSDGIILNNHFNFLNQPVREKNPFQLDDISSCSSQSSICSINDKKKSNQKEQQLEKRQNISATSFKKEQKSSFKKEENISSFQKEKQSKKSISNGSKSNRTNDLPCDLKSNWRESISDNKSKSETSRKSTNSSLFSRAPNTNGFLERRKSPLKRLEISDENLNDKKYLSLKNFKTKKHNESKTSSPLNDSKISLNESTSSTGTEILNNANEINNLRKLDLKSQLEKISQLDIIKNNDNLIELRNFTNNNMNKIIVTPKKINPLPMNDILDEPKDFDTYCIKYCDLIKKIVNPNSNITNKRIIENLVFNLPLIGSKLECKYDTVQKKRIYNIQLIFNRKCCLSAHYACDSDNENGEEICSERLVNCIRINT